MILFKFRGELERGASWVEFDGEDVSVYSRGSANDPLVDFNTTIHRDFYPKCVEYLKEKLK